MPYTKTDYPETIKGLPKGARDIWIAAYNSAEESYDAEKSRAASKEIYAVSVAWAAVKKAYHKKDDQWVINEGKNMNIKEIRQQLDEIGKRNSDEDTAKLKEILKLVSDLISANTITNESITGSQEEKREKLNMALRAIKGDDCYIEGVFADIIIFSSWNSNAAKYYQAEYAEHEGDYIISNIQEVELITIIKKVNEALFKLEGLQSKNETNLFEGRKPHQINEVITLSDYEILEEQKDAKGKTVSLRVKIPVAQKADIINENNRKYPVAVLRESVEQQKRLAEMNSLTMYDTHPKNNNGTVASIIAKIAKLDFNESTGTVSLNEVIFIPTSTGADCMEVIKAGIPLQVSQRGEGYSHTENINGKPIEIVESQQVYGYDLLPPNMAGVQDKGNRVEILESKKEMITMDVTQVQLDEMLAKAKDDAIASIDSKMNDLNEQRKKMDELLAKNEALETMRANEAAVKERVTVADFKFSRFTAPQQKIIFEGLDYSGDKDVVFSRMDEKIRIMDSAIASAKLESRGFASGRHGQSHIEVGDTAIPGGERIAKLNEAVGRILSMDGYQPAKMSDRITAHKNEVMQNFVRINHQALLSEADTMGAGNLPTVNQYAATVIEQAFQIMTALDLCDLGLMTSSPFNVFLETYSESATADINALKIAQGGMISKAAMSLVKFPMYSECLKLRISLYEEALVAAKSAGNYDLEARTIAALAKDFGRRKDKYIYGLMLAKADCHDTVNVATAETLIRVGTTNTWYAVHGGKNYQQNPTVESAAANKNHMWVKSEFIKKFDANNNLAATYIARAGIDVTSALQAVIVVDSSATSQTLVFGYLQSDGSVRMTENDLTSALADYYVLYPDGAIVISGAPVTGGLTAPYKAKYTYTRNARVWMMTPSVGITFEEHLKGLHQLTGQVKSQLLASRYFDANFLAASTSTTDMISNSALYHQAGSNAANIIGASGWIERFAGLVPTKSPIIPDERMIIGVRGAIAVRNHIPYKIVGPILTAGVAESEYQALETEGIDCFVSAKLATVGIGQ